MVLMLQREAARETRHAEREILEHQARGRMNLTEREKVVQRLENHLLVGGGFRCDRGKMVVLLHPCFSGQVVYNLHGEEENQELESWMMEQEIRHGQTLEHLLLSLLLDLSMLAWLQPVEVQDDWKIALVVELMLVAVSLMLFDAPLLPALAVSVWRPLHPVSYAVIS
jgi:hypothetical protein